MKLIMDGAFILQLEHIGTYGLDGGSFAGDSKNKRYAKKQHIKHIEKHLSNKVNLAAIILNKCNLIN